jgi:hypothetical protein
MTKYLTGVLSVIAVGVVLIAYGLLSPRATSLSYPNQNPYATQAAYTYGSAASFGVPAGSVPCSNDTQATYPYGNPYLGNAAVASPAIAQPVRRVVVDRTPVVRRTTAVRTVARTPRRDWKKTALVVSGSTATAAGIGALVGGKKGALVGAALGGGLSTLYETK